MNALERALIYMMAFCFVEVVWTSLIKADPQTGVTKFQPAVFGKSAPIAAPFYGLAGIILVEPYHRYLQFEQLNLWLGLFIRALLFPFVIYFFEIVVGALLWFPPKWLFGQKLKGEGLRAWNYYGRHALFNQFVNLRLFLVWALFWLPTELLVNFLRRF